MSVAGRGWWWVSDGERSGRLDDLTLSLVCTCHGGIDEWQREARWWSRTISRQVSQPLSCPGVSASWHLCYKVTVGRCRLTLTSHGQLTDHELINTDTSRCPLLNKPRWWWLVSGMRCGPLLCVLVSVDVCSM